jgi:hypothetical protein
MADTSLNPQITDAISKTAKATMDPTVVRASGAGKAYQSVAQSTAMAVQDATDNLRNMSLLTSTSISVAIAQILATGQTDPYKDVIQEAGQAMSNAVLNFTDIGKAAATILREFPHS